VVYINFFSIFGFVETQLNTLSFLEKGMDKTQTAERKWK
tara:strand:- start:1212 stop:1328 length:117 start_codon:yes stop_codon:yes gene_type:complete